MLRTITATRYVTPLREGGSLPAIMEADDDGLYVIKFRGAGQGLKALIAELVAGEIARALGLPVPEIVFMELDPVLGRSEPDFEIQALIKASAGQTDLAEARTCLSLKQYPDIVRDNNGNITRYTAFERSKCIAKGQSAYRTSSSTFLKKWTIQVRVKVACRECIA
jgi:hypothetical protein